VEIDKEAFRRLTLLRYKPPADPTHWQAERPTPEQLLQLPATINRVIEQHPWLHLRVDCALSFVQCHLPSDLAARLGIKGCVAADRMLAVAPDGSAYACSQLVHPQHAAGSLLETEPQVLWDNSKALRRYRFFRNKKTFTNSWCGICLKKAACGGSRVFAGDGLGGDPGCPEPVLPPLTQIGKTGRAVDLAAHLRKAGSISVAEYMDRYGVGQRTALKELNASPHAVCTSDKPARKKMDSFISSHADTVRSIQDAIGSTPAGVPYAISEEIEEWLDESTDYPAWIQKVEETRREQRD